MWLEFIFPVRREHDGMICLLLMYLVFDSFYIVFVVYRWGEEMATYDCPLSFHTTLVPFFVCLSVVIGNLLSGLSRKSKTFSYHLVRFLRGR